MPSNLAARLGRRLRPWAAVEDLIEGLAEPGLGQLNIDLPEPGWIPEAVADGLAGVLRHHTDTPGQCYFAIWDGHAGLRPRQGFGATFASHDRRWYLYTAPVAAADEQFEDISGIAPIPPNLWWPEDKRWCVATEIDCASTYIGCDEAAAEALTRSSLDMIRVNPADHIS